MASLVSDFPIKERVAAHDFANIPFEITLSTQAEGRAQLTKWGLIQRLSVARFRLRERFDPDAAHAFLLDFFNSAAVRSSLQPFTAASLPRAAPLTGTVTRVEFERLAMSVTDMAWFSRFKEVGIVTAEIGSGRVRARMEEVFDGATVGDSLREALANPDSEHAELYNAEEQRELIFRVFRCVALGGSMMQWEDELGPYLDAAKSIYKDLVTVVRSDSGGIQVASHAFQVSALEGDGMTTPLFPTASPYNICWVVVDPVKSQVSVFYHAWVPFW